MAIQGGFKMTEVGMIPSDWEVFELNQLYDITSSKRVFQKDWTSAGVPFYRAREIAVMSAGKTPEDDLFITREMFDAYTTQYGKIRENDVLITGVGTLGKVYVVKAKDEFYFKDGNIIWLQWKRKNSSLLLKLFFETNIVIDQIFGNSGGSTVATYTISNAKKTKIPLPPTIEEQQRIANALSDVDSLIANLEKLIDKKKNIKQGAMQQLLTGKKRLPGFGSDERTGSRPTDERRKECHSERSAKREVEESSGYKMTELGMIPSDWEFVPVSELAKDMADVPFGSNLKKEHYTSDPQARIIQLSNIGENGWEDENTKYTTFEHAKTIARCIVPKEESILVAKMMPAGRAIICPKKEKQYVLGSDVIRITANEKLNSKYFVYASKSDAYLKQISDNTQGSTRQRTSISKLRKILILLPSLAEQTAIANILGDMDAEISALETKLAKYRTLKTGMMQQLLTGKVRLI